jgi:hypothetical protein
MQSKIEPLLRAAFLAAIPSAANATAFENQPFDPADKSKWYAFHFLPNRPEVATLGSVGTDAISGLVQIDINIPAGRGKDGIEADVEALRTTFKAGARFTIDSLNVICKGCGRSGTGRKIDGFYRFAVTVEWETRIRR